MMVWELQKDVTATYSEGLTSSKALDYKQYKQTEVYNFKSTSHERYAPEFSMTIRIII
jgi:hypothetical protein